VDLFQVGRNFAFVSACVTAGEQVFFNRQMRKAMATFHDLHHTALHQVRWRQEAVLDELNERAWALVRSVGLEKWLHAPASELSYGRKRALELVTTIAMEPELILLDEPMAGLGHEDIGPVMDLIAHFAEGRTVLMVEHNMKVIAKLCDQVTVLQSGEVLAEGSYEQVSQNPLVIGAYVGGAHD